MKLPIRNLGTKPLRIFMEVYCDEYEVPPGGEAIITLDEGLESIDVYEDQVTVWDKGWKAQIEIVTPQSTD